MTGEMSGLFHKALFAWTAVGVLLCAGCASPAARFHQDAAGRGFAAITADSADTGVTLFRKRMPARGEPLHVYLDGDGKPWISARRVARDPTTRERLILELMERDPEAAVLVGRPCYYRVETPCDAALWTEARYSGHVVNRIAASINGIIEAHDGSPVTLIGYSGGGTLALLAAPLLTRLDTLITIAANLDTAAWARHHGYTPLDASENPAERPPLAAGLRQVHYFGGDDENVPAALVRHVADRQPAARVEIIPGYDHRCCWAEAWPELLGRAHAAARDSEDVPP